MNQLYIFVHPSIYLKWFLSQTIIYNTQGNGMPVEKLLVNNIFVNSCLHQRQCGGKPLKMAVDSWWTNNILLHVVPWFVKYIFYKPLWLPIHQVKVCL